MIALANTWPRGMPANCPLINSVDASHTMYRFIQKTQHDADDFMSTLDEDPSLARQFKRDKNQWCKCHALSFSDDLEKAKDKVLNYSNIQKKFKGIAKGFLSPSDGVILQTGGDNHHFSFWKYDDVLIHQNFTIVHNF